jgi:Ran GTPase-activating protein (RanGAP) involved in mRNA processing and transport
VSVYRGADQGVKRVNKAFNIEFEPAKSMLPGDLRQRAYDCLTMVSTTILEDEEVQALLGPEAKG